jgi:hypothetical protein
MPDEKERRPRHSQEAFMSTPAAFEIRFQSLHRPGCALAFPCDAQGRVDLDVVSERARENYLFAKAMVGRDYAWPQVRPTARYLDD